LCGPAFHVFNQAGTQRGASSVCAAIYISKTLAPGERALYTSQWTTVGTDSLGQSTGPLPAGTYTLRGALDGANVNSAAATVVLVR
jgi:hypothetical protein